MSLGSMARELTGVVTQMPYDYAKTVVIRSFKTVQRANLWSFLCFEGNWTSPPIVNAGTVTVNQGQNTVTFDATASTAVSAIGLIPSPVTQRQFRVGIGTIYNIRAIDETNPSAVVLTLDRNYQESSGNGVSYQIYQVYYPSPVKGWKAWMGVRDIVNFNDLVYTKTRAFIDRADPQRSIYYIPTHVVPYEVDMNPDSSTYQYQLFELWGGPVFQLTYQLYGVRTELDFSAESDELPPQIGEDLVMSQARYYAYQWAEANWKPGWGVKPAFMGLMREEVSNNRKSGDGLYNRLLREYRMQDRALVDNFRTKARRNWSWANMNGWYSSIAGYASPGAPW